MTDASQQPDPASPYTGLSNTDLAALRTEFATKRTEMSEDRTDLAKDRNRLAAERTLLAWIRTSLSMITFGFGIDRFFKYLNQTQASEITNQLNEERFLGLGLITLGVLSLAVAAINHWRLLKDLDKPRFTYNSGSSLGITVSIILVFLGLSSFIPMITQGASLTEIVRLDSPTFQNLTALTVFSIMISFGASLSLEELIAFWKKPALVGRSLLAIVVFPVITLVVVLYLFKLPVFYDLALILLIAAPGPPLLGRRAAMAGARIEFVLALQVTLALAAIVFTPLILKLFDILFAQASFNVNVLQVAKQVALVQLLPLSIGLGIRTLWNDAIGDINVLLRTIANTLFAVLGILSVIISVSIVSAFGAKLFVLSVVLTFVGLAIGHFTANGLDPDIQAGIAVATIARNVGLALFIAAVTKQPQIIPAIAGILAAGVVGGVPYSVWMKRRSAAAKVSSVEVATA